MGTKWRNTTLTIPNAGTESEVLDLNEGGARYRITMGFGAPTGLVETTNIHVAKEVGGTFYVLQSGGVDITLPADKATVVDVMTWGALKLVAATVAAARVFDVVGAAASTPHGP